MATPREWADGYLAQARVDLRGVELVQGNVPSVTAMLLQMVLEKIGKAALLRSGAIDVSRATTSHAAATRMLQQLAANRRACRVLDWRRDVIRYQLAPIVADLERAQPQLAAGGACLEYPWEDPSGVVRWPARDLVVAASFGPHRAGGQLVLRFTGDLCARFDGVFP